MRFFGVLLVVWLIMRRWWRANGLPAHTASSVEPSSPAEPAASTTQTNDRTHAQDQDTADARHPRQRSTQHHLEDPRRWGFPRHAAIRRDRSYSDRDRRIARWQLVCLLALILVLSWASWDMFFNEITYTSPPLRENEDQPSYEIVAPPYSTQWASRSGMHRRRSDSHSRTGRQGQH